MHISSLRYWPPMPDEETHLTTTVNPKRALCGAREDVHRPHALPVPADSDPRRQAVDTYEGNVYAWIDERDDLCPGCREAFAALFDADPDLDDDRDDDDQDPDTDDGPDGAAVTDGGTEVSDAADRPECRRPECSRPARGGGGVSGRFCSDGCEVAASHERHDAREAARDAAREVQEEGGHDGGPA